MIESNMQDNKSLLKAAILIVLILTVLPLVLFILIQFVPRQDNTPRAETANVGTSSGRSIAAERRAPRTENLAARQKAKTARTASVPHDIIFDPGPADLDFDAPEDISLAGIGAVVPNAPRSKQATPSPPGTVPGDSGIVPQIAEPPEPVDEVSPQGDLRGGPLLPPIPPENMRGIGGARRIDPDDLFFRQPIPNQFNN